MNAFDIACRSVVRVVMVEPPPEIQNTPMIRDSAFEPHLASPRAAPRRRPIWRRTLLPALVASTLAACQQEVPEERDTVAANGVNAIGSEDRLVDDDVRSLSYAQAVAAAQVDVEPADSDTTGMATAGPGPAEAGPDAAEPATVPTVSLGSNSVIVVPQASRPSSGGEVQLAAAEPDPAETASAAGSPAEPAPAPSTVEVAPEPAPAPESESEPAPTAAPMSEAEPAPTPRPEPTMQSAREADSTSDADAREETATERESDGDDDAAADARVEPATATDPAPKSTLGQRFTSHTTDGFDGTVQDDGSIVVRWDVDRTARGYNVYRQGDYIETVFEATYTDDDTTDGSYYYEIQAFDSADNFNYVARGLTVEVAGSGRENPQAKSGPGVDLADYDLVFNDEFDGGSLDLGKWDTSYIWGDEIIINSEEQHYVDVQNEPDFGFDPFTVADGTLTIESIPTPPELLDKANGQPYLSGVITSYDAFKFTYGYVETRAKTPYGKGFWSAFWLLNAYYPADGDDDPEIDIMEHIGDNQDTVYHTYHYYDDGELRSTESLPVVGIDFTSDFHTFAVDWRPGVLVFYVDGVETHRIDDPKVSKDEMYVIANTALGGWWPGSPDATTPFPARYELDYIRVYQKRTPYDDPQLFNDGASRIPYADTMPGVSPNRRPTAEQWPEMLRPR